VHRDQISELSHGVNDALTLYLEVHNGIFASRWWRSLPIPGLFKSIPFDRYEIQISKVEQILREIEGHARALHNEATPDEKVFLATLHRYTVALLKAVVALTRVVVGLKRKTSGERYNMSAYNADVAAYKDAEKDYYALGEEMNRKWRAYSELVELYTTADLSIQESCEVHIDDVKSGFRIERWRIGEQVERETYDKLKDQNGILYVLVYYEQGAPNAMIVAKPLFEKIKQSSDELRSEMRRESSKSLEKLLKRLD